MDEIVKLRKSLKALQNKIKKKGGGEYEYK